VSAPAGSGGGGGGGGEGGEKTFGGRREGATDGQRAEKRRGGLKEPQRP